MKLVFLKARDIKYLISMSKRQPKMNHCSKVILLWIAMVVGLTLSCRETTVDGPEIEWMRTYGGPGF